MQLEIQLKIQQNPKMTKFLNENSEWYKYLNRSPLNFNKFVEIMKEQYKLRTTDKINEVVENMDLISNILNIIQ